MQLRKISQLYSLHARTLSGHRDEDDNRVRHSGPDPRIPLGRHVDHRRRRQQD
jgi:hypothetical protein